jgi:hypothetical protein
MSQKKLPYLLTDTDGIFQLIPNISYPYYQQVQTAMHVTKMNSCDLVIWSPSEITIMNIAFDSSYFNQEISPLINNYFHDYLLPAILTAPPQQQPYKCYFCSSSLREEGQIKNSKDYSIGCGCYQCQCDNWAHWKCTGYTKRSKVKQDWICLACTDH